MAGVPQLNVFQECGKLKSSTALSTVEDISNILSKFFTRDSEEISGTAVEGVHPVIAVNLNEENDALDIESAKKLLATVSRYSPAYGARLTECEEKAAETLQSLVGSIDSEEINECRWFGSIDRTRLPTMLPEVFTENDHDYWQDWIGFFLVCVWPDQRTLTYLIGMDSD